MELEIGQKIGFINGWYQQRIDGWNKLKKEFNWRIQGFNKRKWKRWSSEKDTSMPFSFRWLL